MIEIKNLKNISKELISSYETQIQNIEYAVNSTNSIFDEFQESIPDKKQEKENLNNEVKNILAKNENLRKKDFDAMMNKILIYQRLKENEIRSLINQYLIEEKALIRDLKCNLKNIENSPDQLKPKEFQTNIEEDLSKQLERKNLIKTKLNEFQKDQELIIEGFRKLKSKGKDLHIKDFKLLINELFLNHNKNEPVYKKILQMRPSEMESIFRISCSDCTKFDIQNAL